VHIKIEIELVRFLLDTGDFFKQLLSPAMKSLPEDWAYKEKCLRQQGLSGILTLFFS